VTPNPPPIAGIQSRVFSIQTKWWSIPPPPMPIPHLARPIGRNQTGTTNLALAPSVHRGNETSRPAPRDVGNQASKFFSTEKQGDGTEVTEKGSMEQDSLALRAEFDPAVRETPRSFSSVSSHVLPASPC